MCVKMRLSHLAQEHEKWFVVNFEDSRIKAIRKTLMVNQFWLNWPTLLTPSFTNRPDVDFDGSWHFLQLQFPTSTCRPVMSLPVFHDKINLPSNAYRHLWSRSIRFHNNRKTAAHTLQVATWDDDQARFSCFLAVTFENVRGEKVSTSSPVWVHLHSKSKQKKRLSHWAGFYGTEEVYECFFSARASTSLRSSFTPFTLPATLPRYHV